VLNAFFAFFQGFGGDISVPTTVKRQAVNLMHKIKRCEEEKVLVQSYLKNTVSYFQKYHHNLEHLLHPPLALSRITAVQSEMSLVRMFLHELNRSVPIEFANAADELMDSSSSCCDVESVSGDSCDLDLNDDLTVR